MAKAVAIFTGGITELRQYAIREDGAVFKRFQEKHPRFGYRWTTWTATGEVVGDNARNGMTEMQSGFCTLHRATPNDCNINNRAWFNNKGEIRVRLP